MSRPRKTLAERFWAKVERRGPDECWPWRGENNGKGYGRIRVGPGRHGPWLRAHRVAYELLVGPIPTGKILDHTCHNADLSCAGGAACTHRRCCNPAHLDPVTSGENTARAVARRTLAVRSAA